jgi:hypothetical protein
MPYVKFDGSYNAFITGRDVDSALHYEDASNDTCIGFVAVAREGDTEITEAEYAAMRTEIETYNRDNPPPTPPEPEPQPDPFALIADKLDDLSAEIRKAGRGVEADKMHEVAEVARAASGR